jgi:hypothetical protein
MTAVNLLTQDEAIAALGPHVDALFKIATAPWDEYHARMPQDLLVTFSTRTRATAIHDLMVRDAIKYAASADRVRPFERQMMRGMVIDDRIAIRFKKLDEDSYSRGHYTRQVEEYRSQQSLDGIDAAHHLELGYVLNRDETEVAEVRIVYPTGRNNAWWSRIDGADIQPVVIDLLPPDGPEGGGAIITPKGNGVVIPLRRKTDEG